MRIQEVPWRGKLSPCPWCRWPGAMYQERSLREDEGVTYFAACSNALGELKDGDCPVEPMTERHARKVDAGRKWNARLEVRIEPKVEHPDKLVSSDGCGP